MKEQIEKQAIEEMAKVIETTEQIARDAHCGLPSPTMYAKDLYWKGYRKQEWISVDERLPDMSGKYLVATFDGRVGIGNLIDYYCNGDLSFDNYKVTHWMPLPAPPKGE